MIIRENEKAFIMIRQHDHAVISEHIITHLTRDLLSLHERSDSVLYAIKMHDFGWIKFDEAPFWNDEKQEPFSFIDYPNIVKTILYKHGIEEVVKEDLYAGLLVSKHYSYFLANDPSREVYEFVANEEARQKQIQQRLNVDQDLLQFHFELLKLADDLSLFVCLHEPRPTGDVHYFFEKGVYLPKAFHKQVGERLQLNWQSEQTLDSSAPIFSDSFTLSIPYKQVLKEDITSEGLRKAYEKTKEDTLTIQVK
ncbi:DUF3891 family protein [Oceanobacillus sp. CAU 1775]